MKKIILMLLCFVGALNFSSCSSDDDKSSESSALTLVKSDVKFTSNPGEGSIEFTSTSAVTATSSEEWCTATVSGSKVLVTVTGNTALESRNALVTLSAAGESVSVPVNQRGSIFRLGSDELYLVAGVGAEEVSISLKTTVDYTIESDDWIHADEKDGSLVITFDDNDGYYRVGNVNISSTLGEESFVVAQLSANNGIDGYYAAYYKATSSADWTGVLSTFLMNDEGTGYNIYGVAPSLPFQFIYDSKTGYYAIPNNCDMGTYGSYYLFNHNAFYNSAGSVYYFSGGTDAERLFYDIEIEDNGTLSILLADYTQNTGFYPYGPYLYAYSTNEISSSTRLGLLKRYIYLQFYSYL